MIYKGASNEIPPDTPSPNMFAIITEFKFELNCTSRSLCLLTQGVKSWLNQVLKCLSHTIPTPYSYLINDSPIPSPPKLEIEP